MGKQENGRPYYNYPDSTAKPPGRDTANAAEKFEKHALPGNRAPAADKDFTGQAGKTGQAIQHSSQAAKAGKIPVKRAVALKYDAEKGTTPIITAVGKGLVADKIIEVAEQSGIAQVEDEFQANALSSFDAGSKVPKFLYDLVAEVLLFVEEADIKNQSGGALH